MSSNINEDNFEFFKQIDEHIKEYGNPFGTFFINKSYFPKCFIDAIEKELTKLSPVSTMDEELQFIYDNSGNLVLLATSNNGHSKLLISNRNTKINLNLQSTRTNIETLLLKGYGRNYLSRLEKEYMSILENNFKNENKIQIRKTCDELISKAIYNTNYTFKQNGSSLLEHTNVHDDLQSTIDMIKKYLDYLNDLYLASTKLPTIIFTPADAEKSTTLRGPITSSTPERKNDIIAYDSRRNILLKYNPIYNCIANSTKKDSCDYFCFMYKLNEDEYYLVLEPFGGENRTKLVHLYSEKEIDFDMFMNLSTQYLEKSNSETLEAENIARFNHTSIESFENTICYALTKDSKKYHISNRTKENIDNLFPVDVDVLSLK